jgi:hypothetical protein
MKKLVCLLAVQCIPNKETFKCQRLLVTLKHGAHQWTCDFSDSDYDSVFQVYFLIDCIKKAIYRYLCSLRSYDLNLTNKIRSQLREHLLILENINVDLVEPAFNIDEFMSHDPLIRFTHYEPFEIMPFNSRPLSLIKTLVEEEVNQFINTDIFELKSLFEQFLETKEQDERGSCTPSLIGFERLNFLSVYHGILDASTEILSYGTDYTRESSRYLSCQRYSLQATIDYVVSCFCTTNRCPSCLY